MFKMLALAPFDCLHVQVHKGWHRKINHVGNMNMDTIHHVTVFGFREARMLTSSHCVEALWRKRRQAPGVFHSASTGPGGCFQKSSEKHSRRLQRKHLLYCGSSLGTMS